MGKKKKKDTAYRAVVSGAKGVLRILVYICAVLLIVFAGKTAYSFGYLILTIIRWLKQKRKDRM